MGLLPERDHRPPLGRFAPSPTGPLHFGSLVAALASYLQAKSRGGLWRLRMDDLDTPRVVVGAAAHIQQQLLDHGLAWDGDVVYQSQRHTHYHAAFQQLAARGWVYPCTCSRREIAAAGGLGLEGVRYLGTCRGGPTHRGRPMAWRLRTVEGLATQVADQIQGGVTQDVGAAVGDFVLWRADGLFSYQLATVVDDAALGVTEVIRGADLLASTPRQVLLQQHLGLATPIYGHVPLVLDPQQQQKLSKQTHAPPLTASAASSALGAALTFLGHPPPTSLKGATVRTVLAWGLQHWEIQRVPSCHENVALPTV